MAFCRCQQLAQSAPQQPTHCVVPFLTGCAMGMVLYRLGCAHAVYCSCKPEHGAWLLQISDLFYDGLKVANKHEAEKLVKEYYAYESIVKYGDDVRPGRRCDLMLQRSAARCTAIAASAPCIASAHAYLLPHPLAFCGTSMRAHLVCGKRRKCLTAIRTSRLLLIGSFSPQPVGKVTSNFHDCV
jgi:hypothetical protein